MRRDALIPERTHGVDLFGAVDMTTTTAPEMQGPMERLITELSEQGCRHLNEAETELGQTGVLLDEAITKLSSAFMSLHEAVRAQQEHVERMLASVPASSEDKEKLRVLGEDIGTRVNEAITGLQFQDLTGQLIARTSKRIAGVRDMLSDVNQMVGSIPADAPEEIATPALRAVSASLMVRSTALEELLRKSVLQHHMESGDIELF